MTSPQHNQGYLGDLHTKTLPELRELLDRQENILKKQKFLQTLPDKGLKVKSFAETLKKLITEREDINKSALSDNKRTIISTDQNNGQFNNKPSTEKGDNSDKCFRDVVNLGGDNSDMDKSLSACMERVTLSTGVGEEKINEQCLSNKFINSYERVVKQANQRPKDRRAFKPNSTLNIAKVQELPEVFKYRSRHTMPPGEHSSMESVNKQCQVKQVKEESAVCLPDYKHERSVLIPVEESLQLVEEQRKRHEDLLTRQAAERLASRLHIKLEDYNPEGTNMNYRVPGDMDTDSDDEPELEGYED